MSDDRFGTLRFQTCAHAILAGDNIIHYCCLQPEVRKSGKYPLQGIMDGDKYIETAMLSAVSLKERDFLEPFSWERQKEKEEMVEKALRACTECQFYEMKKEDLSKKISE